MTFSIANARKFRSTLRFLILVIACPIGSINCLGSSILFEPVLRASKRPPVQAAVPAVQSIPVQDFVSVAGPVSEESLTAADTGSLGYGVRAIGAMIVVLGMIWVTMILLKRYMQQRFGALGQQRRMQVLETLPIGEKRTITLIRIDNEQLLLASTPGSVALLKEIRVEQDAGKPVEAPAPKFAEMLADEVGSAQRAPVPNPLQRLVSLRRELEAR